MRCSVPNCISHKKFSKMNYYRVPKDPIVRCEWENVLGFKFKNHSRVCRLHFKEDDIIDTMTFELDELVVNI